jgi:hypothetical protein
VIVNPYSVLTAFVCAVEFALGAVAAGVGVAACLRARRAAEVDAGSHLLFLVALTVAAVGAAGLPLLVLTLGSYVPQWPGVMCIQGVTRVGEGSPGAAGWLPGLLAALAVLRPAAVAAAGAWLTMHVVNRSTRSGPLAARVLAVAALAGALAAAAGGLELAYLLIPKEDRVLADGCCTAPPSLALRASETRTFLGALPRPDAAGTFTAVLAGSGLVLAAGCGALRAFAARGRAARWPITAVAAAGVVFVLLGAVFAHEVACPEVLGLPHHRCHWCLLASAPENAVAAALAAMGALSAVWAAVAAWCGAGPDSAGAAARVGARLLGAAAFGFAATALFVLVQAALS